MTYEQPILGTECVRRPCAIRSPVRWLAARPSCGSIAASSTPRNGLGDAQRAVCVDRDGQLVGRGFAERRLDRTGLRAVRRAGGVQRDGALFDAAARHEVPRRVVDDLVAVDRCVIVRRRNRERMIVEHARREQDERRARRVPDLVRRRRLVQLAGDRRVLVGVERERIAVAVPADDVERVVRDDILRVAALGGDAHVELTDVVDGILQHRHAEIALVVRRVLRELPELVAELARDRDLTRRLSDEQRSSACAAAAGTSSPSARTGSRAHGIRARRTTIRARPRRSARIASRRRWRCGRSTPSAR